MGLALLYIAAMQWMAIWVSCLTGKQATSVLVLATIWLILVMAVPNLSPYVARALRPTRNPLEIEILRGEAMRDILEPGSRRKDEDLRRCQRLRGKVVGKVQLEQVEERERAERRRLQELKYEEVASLARQDAYARLDETFQRELDSQVTLSRWINRILPFSCLAMFSSEITDTGVVGKQRFLDQIRTYQHDISIYGYEEWLGVNQYRIDHKGEGKPWSEIRKKPVPLFVYTPPAGTDYLREVVVDAGLIAGMAVLFFMLSYLAFIRYDVR